MPWPAEDWIEALRRSAARTQSPTDNHYGAGERGCADARPYCLHRSACTLALGSVCGGVDVLQHRFLELQIAQQVLDDIAQAEHADQL